VQLDRKRQQFEKRGIKIAAVSFDPVAVLQNFAQRTGVKLTLLSDPQSKVIRAFGILNDSIPKDHQFYGIPYPGDYLIDQNGVVQSKFFEEKYADRYTAGEILVRTIGADTSGPSTQTETDHLTVITSASDEILRGGNRLSLVAEVDLKPKMHVYAPGVEGYIPVDWEMEEVSGVTNYPAEYPGSEMLHLPAINEIVPVYQGHFRMVRDVMIGQPNEIQHLLNAQGELVIKGSFRYQACDDKICYLPKTVPLEWTFRFEQHDRTRVPEDIRRKPGGE
jgi:AhpC/TSA family/Thiol:disulfide interchange protein DsbD, N-terminal